MSRSDDHDDGMCWFNRFHHSSPPCRNRAVWQSHGLGNIMDCSRWCVEHPPDPKFRVLIRPLPEGEQGAPQ